MADGTIPEVVLRLRTENCRAFLELREFQCGFDDVLKNVEQLARASDEIHASLQEMGVPMGERTGRLSTHATEIVLAFRAVRIAVLSWNVAGVSDSALDRTAMRDVVAQLRAGESEAMLDLRAFDSSSDQLLQSLGLLALAVGELHVAVTTIGTPDTIEGYKRLRVARERAVQLSTKVTQVLSDYRELRAELGRWNIIGADASS